MSQSPAREQLQFILLVAVVENSATPLAWVHPDRIAAQDDALLAARLSVMQAVQGLLSTAELSSLVVLARPVFVVLEVPVFAVAPGTQLSAGWPRAAIWEPLPQAAFSAVPT